MQPLHLGCRWPLSPYTFIQLFLCDFGETEREDPRELEAKETRKSSLKEFRRKPEHGLKTAMRNKENLIPSPGLGVESGGTGGT